MKSKNVSPLPQFILIFFVADTKSPFEKHCVERINFSITFVKRTLRANYVTWTIEE